MHRPPRHPDPELDQVYFKYNLATNTWAETVRLCVPSRRIRTPVRRLPVGLRPRLSTPPDPVSPVVCLLSTVCRRTLRFGMTGHVYCTVSVVITHPAAYMQDASNPCGSWVITLQAVGCSLPATLLNPDTYWTALARDRPSERPSQALALASSPYASLRHRSWPSKSIPR